MSDNYPPGVSDDVICREFGECPECFAELDEFNHCVPCIEEEYTRADFKIDQIKGK